MTQPNDLPPLPKPWSPAHERLDVDIYVKAPDTFVSDQMLSYGLQCAEAAVERERARCREAVASMRRLLRLDDSSETLRQCHEFAANLLDFIVSDIDRSNPAHMLDKRMK